ncbi:MAG TPA: transporter substrate-binding domain-containing protein [Acetobacteraceae bacterium]|nr:transporter substrate-binding domain-containing protein [Acetobacteraceae bacterium]
MAYRILLALALACFAVPALAQESQLDVVLKRDKLIVGTYSTSPPLAYVDDKGELVGFEIDMAHEIAKDLLGDPNKVEFVVLQSDGRFPAALSGKIDFGLCSTTIFPERAIRIAFTRPYLDTGNSFIVRKDAGIKTIKELNDPKYTFATLNVPPAIERAKQMMPNVKLLLLDSPSALFLAVKTGRATAFAIDKPIADFYEHENDDLTRLDVNGTIFAYVSIFLKPGDFKWWLFLDTWVGELRSGTRYFKYVEWYQKWLHKDPSPQRFYDFNKY